MTDAEKAQKIIQEYVKDCRRLNGSVVPERSQWNTVVSADAIRHMALGISDDNPLWLDMDTARASVGKRVAPPAFLCSVQYPVLHGLSSSAPLSNLIVELGFEWENQIVEGDHLTGIARQIDAVESRDRNGNPLAMILSEVEYQNEAGTRIGKAEAILVRSVQFGHSLRLDREIHTYDPEELEAIGMAQRTENRRGSRAFGPNELSIGDEIPTLVRGPLSIGDMIGWLSAVGPAYRPGSVGYRDGLSAPRTVLPHPITGWPTHKSQHHEDFLLAGERGMPAPFDHGVMRLGWITPLITNWMGDNGVIKNLKVRLHAPILYGDTTWYHGKIVSLNNTGQQQEVRLEITGINQLGETTTTGEAVAVVPIASSEAPAVAARSSAVQSAVRSSTPDVCLQFAERVKQNPDAVALVFEDEAWTYSELNAKSEALAVRLLGAGVEPGDHVGICLPRSSDWIVSILGVLKAGATFVPLDPEYPESRLATMIGQVNLRLLIVRPEFDIQLAIGPDRTLTVSTSAEGPANPAVAESLPLPSVNSEEAAYIVFTSGTTGVPNGVATARASLGEYARVMARLFDVTPEDACLHTASFSYSASMRQVFVPLCAGAALVVASETQRRDPNALFKLMRNHKISVWDTVPSVFRLALESLTDTAPHTRSEVLPLSLRLITLTGEKLGWDLVRDWNTILDHPARLVNLYSHSETAGTVSTFTIPETVPPDVSAVPIGRPVEGARVYILDTEKSELQPGQIGEIWVGGSRLAIHYMNDEALTDERFVDDPFAPGGRMYRTGDLGRMNENGDIEFIGRTDDRVNIRGHRVEPAEVEQALLRYEPVSQVVVAGRVDPHGEMRLVAYLVTTSPPERIEVRKLLKSILPDHMAPSVYVHLHTLPINSNGKVDRSALPEPDWAHPEHLDSTDPENHANPESSLEHRLAEIWCEILGISRIEPDDHFLDVGGDSIKSIRILNKVQTSFNVSLPISALFITPTVRKLASKIASVQNSDS